MIQRLLSIAIISSLILAACQKDDASDPNKNTPCDFPNRISKMVTYNYPNSSGQQESIQYLMIYNTAGQLIKRQLKGSNASSYEDYDYFEYDAAGNCIKHDWKTFSGAPSRYYEYDYIDQKRMTTRFYTSISPGAPTNLMQTTSFFYDAEQLVKIENDQPQFGNPPSVGTFSYSNDGKRVQYDYDLDNSGDIETTIYYYSDLINPVAIPELQFGYPENTFLKDSIVDPDFQANSYKFKYELDDAGRVVTKSSYDFSLNTYILLERYYYDCQQ